MNVLAIESSGVIGSVAACSGSGTLAEKSLEHGMEHGRLLVALMDEVVRLAGWNKKEEIELVAVSRGPGSFTGLRVGIACAKTLSTFTQADLIGVCSMDALAQNAPEEFTHILTVIDAKRGQVYAAAYERRNGVLHPKAAPAIMRPAEAVDLIGGKRAFVLGDALTRYEEVFTSAECEPAPPELWRIRASSVALLGLDAFAHGRSDDPIMLEPMYLRRPEAEERRLARARGDS